MVFKFAAPSIFNNFFLLCYFAFWEQSLFLQISNISLPKTPSMMGVGKMSKFV